MVFPRMPYRMNPAWFIVRPYRQGDLTPQDPDFRGPKGTRVYQNPITIKGQLVGYRGFFRMQRSMTGQMEQSAGSAVFRPSVLRAMGYMFELGDRIIKINDTVTDFNIIHVTPLSPYRGRNLLIYIEWEQQRKEVESI